MGAGTFGQVTTVEESADSGEAPEFPAIAPVAEMFQRPDVTLQTLSRYANAFGVGVTLYLPWGVATGATVGHREFYADLAAKFRATNINTSEGSGTREEWEGVLESYVADNFDVVVNESAEEHADQTYRDGFDLTSHLHLKDARCYIGAFPTPILHDYMRIRLTDITGWSYGTLPE